MALMLQRERLVKANRDRRARTYQHLQLRSSQTAIRTLSSCAAVAASRCQGDVVRWIQRIRRTFPHLHGGLSRPQTRPRIPAPGLAIRQPPTLPGGTCRTGNTHTHPFNGPLSGTTRVSRYEKGKTNLDFTEARDSEWQWHQLGHMQVCTSLQTDNHASTPPLSFYKPDALPATRPTVSKY